MISQRRKTFWLAGAVVRSMLTSASDAALITSLNAAALALRPFTIIRSRGFMHMVSDQIVGTENVVCAFGKIVVSDEAVAVGVSAVPSPWAQDSSSWLALV